jgi:surface antigen
VQTDGNLVEYTSANHAVWATNTVQGGGDSTTPASVTVYGAAGMAYANSHLGYPYARYTGPDRWSFYQGNCTSWDAYRINQLNGMPQGQNYTANSRFWNYYRGQHWGHAVNWGTAARHLGIPVNGTPARGAVAWYPYGHGAYGHVAYVEQVNSSTSVVISEMNFDGRYGFRVRTITTAGGWPTGFIHIHDR